MYVNKCTKCGAEFETKNPKRVICPNCLYPDKSTEGGESLTESKDEPKLYPRSYSAGSIDSNSYRHQSQQGQGNYRNNRENRSQNYDNGYRQQSGNKPYQNGGNYNRRFNNNFNRPNNSGYGGRPQQNRFNNKPSFARNNNFNRRPNKRVSVQKQLLVSKEQLAQIEELYKKVLPLPNSDIHEVIGQAIELEPRKVFFGINLIRQKMFLPKLPFPKRKLAVTPEQLSAIKMLYEPLLPLPPIGCHKIIAVQLKMDEWRVHVGISVVRRQMGLERWNEGRADAPPKKVQSQATEDTNSKISEEKKVKRARKTKKVEEIVSETVEKDSATVSVEEVTPKKRTRKKKTETEAENS